MTPTTQFLLLILLLTLQTTLSSLSSSSACAETKVQTILEVYFQPNKTVTTVAKPENSSVGRIVMMDSPLTEGIERGSKVVGRAQGTYVVVTEHKWRVDVMSMTLFFTEGKFRGSSINVFGRYYNHLIRSEMAVVGGTGAFRFATGYVMAEISEPFGFDDGDTARFYTVIEHPQI